MKKTRFIAGLLFLGMLSVMMLAACMKVVALPPVNTDPNGIAIKGYDPVAYFTEGEPVKGKNEFEFSWRGARWLFASSEHRDLFMSDPEKYAPQYGGYWAYAVSRGTTADIDPESWSVVDGKLYLNLNKDIKEIWGRNLMENIRKADTNWPLILNE